MTTVGHAESTAAVRRAVQVAGSQSALARSAGATQGSVWRWINGRSLIPAEHVLKVEAATGVSRHDLRPDLYPRESAPAAQPDRDAA